MNEENLLESDIPEKFKDPKTGAPRMDSFVKSYKSLEQRLSQFPTPPKTPQDYKVTCDHGLFDPDDELNAAFHARGFTQEQVQFVYDMAAEKMMPMIIEMAADYEADREVEKLINHFGGENKWKDVSRQLLAFGQKQMPDDVLDTLASSYEGVMALYRMMKGDTPAIAKNADLRGESSTQTLDLQAMMRDPKYWRDQDPSFIAKVTEGFQKMYGKSE